LDVREIFSILKEAEILMRHRRYTTPRPWRVLRQRPHPLQAIHWLSRATHPIKPLVLMAALR
jgi:hypothetical protein